MEHHACVNLGHLFPYSQHFFANAQGAPGNYFWLLEKHRQELVWTLTRIVQTVGSGNRTPSGMSASTLGEFMARFEGPKTTQTKN